MKNILTNTIILLLFIGCTTFTATDLSAKNITIPTFSQEKVPINHIFPTISVSRNLIARGADKTRFVPKIINGTYYYSHSSYMKMSKNGDLYHTRRDLYITKNNNHMWCILSTNGKEWGYLSKTDTIVTLVCSDGRCHQYKNNEQIIPPDWVKKISQQDARYITPTHSNQTEIILDKTTRRAEDIYLWVTEEEREVPSALIYKGETYPYQYSRYAYKECLIRYDVYEETRDNAIVKFNSKSDWAYAIIKKEERYILVDFNGDGVYQAKLSEGAIEVPQRIKDKAKQKK